MAPLTWNVVQPCLASNDGYLKNLEMPRMVQHIFLHSVLWLLLTLVFFACTSASNSTRNRLFGRVIFSTCVGILLILWQRTAKFKPWSYLLLLLHCALRQKLYFHRAFYNLPSQTLRERKRDRKKRVYYGNLTFDVRWQRGPSCGTWTQNIRLDIGIPGWRVTTTTIQ